MQFARIFVLTLLVLLAQYSQADGDAAGLAKKLANPLADIVAIPLVYDYDENIGPDDEGWRSTYKLQPIVPITLNEDWNLISRTVLPVIDQYDVAGEDQSGIGDTVQSFFFSPSKKTESGLIWGVGPAFSLDTATDDQLGSGQWAGGLTGLALHQGERFTFGALTNHLEGFSADEGREEISATLVQPFVALNTPGAVTVTLSSESTYDWNAREWTVPVNLTVTKLVFLGKLPVSIGAGVRYWAQTTDQSPEGLGFRLQATVVLPKRIF